LQTRSLRFLNVALIGLGTVGWVFVLQYHLRIVAAFGGVGFVRAATMASTIIFGPPLLGLLALAGALWLVYWDRMRAALAVSAISIVGLLTIGGLPALAVMALGGAPKVMDISGMKPQLKIVRSEVARRGWKILCEGHRGEEGILRVEGPSGPLASEKFTAWAGEIASSIVDVQESEASNSTCDREPNQSFSSRPQFVLAFGTQEQLVKPEAVARACGFAKTYIRPWKAGDAPGVEPKPGWLALDAGEDIMSRDGPFICFVNLGLKPTQYPK